MSPEYGRARGLPIAAIAIVSLGLLIGYLACLHGGEINARSLVAFVVWSGAAILVGFLVTWCFKYILLAAMLFIGMMWYADSPSFRNAAVEARGLRGDLCKLITIEVENLPIKEWIC